MSDESIAAIEEAHVLAAKAHPEDDDYCVEGMLWPCDTAIVLQRLREVEQERDAIDRAWRAQYDHEAKRADAALAEVARLEEHLRRIIHER